MPTVIDLDHLAPPDKTVRLGGKTYKVPADPPARWFLQLQQLAGAEASEADQFGQLQDGIVELIRLRQPAASEQRIRDALGNLGIVSTMKVIGAIYTELGDDIQEDAPAPKAVGGTRSSSRKRPTKSRSTP